MRRFTFLAGVLATAVALWCQPAAAAGVRAVPLSGLGALGAAETVQFRFPWESRPSKPKKRGQRPARSPKPKAQKPGAAARSGKGGSRGKAPAAVPAAPQDPLDAKLPPADGPVGVATPRGETGRQQQGWAAVASQVTAPADPPLLSPDGPAPAPANVIALLARLGVGEQTKTPRVAAAASEPDEPETPDRHVPLPPTRPPAPGEPAARGDGLAPEGRGLSPEGQALAPEAVPLPPRRPGDAKNGDMAALEPEEPKKPEPPPGPTPPDIPLPVTSHEEDADCRALASENVTEADRIPPIEGPGACGGGPLVLLKSVKRADGGEIKIHPAATLRCSMARTLANLLRDDVAPAAKEGGTDLARLDIAGSFQCRGRNGATGGKMSEHGRANAIDLSGFGFSDGKALGIFAPELPKVMADKVKAAACEKFNTVLGPGSDGFHETHLHLDLQPRRSKAKLCQWADPEIAKKSEEKQDAEDGDDDKSDAKSGKDDARDHVKGAAKGDAKADDKDEPADHGSARRKTEPHGSSKAQAAP